MLIIKIIECLFSQPSLKSSSITPRHATFFTRKSKAAPQDNFTLVIHLIKEFNKTDTCKLVLVLKLLKEIKYILIIVMLIIVIIKFL